MRSGSLHDLASSVRSGAVSAVAITEAALARCRAAQPLLNAFTDLDTEGALEAATTIDAAVARGEDPGPLAGVPVAVKDLIDQAGRPNTRGSSAPPEIPSETAPCIRRLEAAGAIVIGRTGLHEYAFGFSSENHWFGPVHNPWDPSLAPGGSSGGSGVAVSAGLVPVALGTDTGGSVRVPAALCGVVGLKVTHGRVPVRGVYPLAPSLDTVGPLARSVGDAAAVYEIIAGDDPFDPWSVPVPLESVESSTELAALTVGVPHPWVDVPMVPEQRRAFLRFLDALSDAGAAVVDLDIPDLGPSHHAQAGLYFEVAGVHRERWTTAPEEYGPEVRARLASAMEITGEQYLAALRWRRGTLAVALRAFDSVDVIATPTVASLRKVIGEDHVHVDGEEMPYARAKGVFTAPVNHLGLPALALPLPGPSVPPPSVQIIGPPWSEARLLGAGLSLEHESIVSTATPPHWRPGGFDTNPERNA